MSRSRILVHVFELDDGTEHRLPADERRPLVRDGIQLTTGDRVRCEPGNGCRWFVFAKYEGTGTYLGTWMARL